MDFSHDAQELEITREEAVLIMSALYAVSPTGGGSEAWALAQKIGNASKIGMGETFHKMICLQKVAVVETLMACGLLPDDNGNFSEIPSLDWPV